MNYHHKIDVLIDNRAVTASTIGVKPNKRCSVFT